MARRTTLAADEAFLATLQAEADRRGILILAPSPLLAAIGTADPEHGACAALPDHRHFSVVRPAYAAAFELWPTT